MVIVAFALVAVCPGTMLIAVVAPGSLKELDVAKLLVLSVGITLPFLILNIFMWSQMITRVEEGTGLLPVGRRLRMSVLTGTLSAATVLYTAIWIKLNFPGLEKNSLIAIAVAAQVLLLIYVGAAIQLFIRRERREIDAAKDKPSSLHIPTLESPSQGEPSSLV